MMEQNFKPSLHLQAIREIMELELKYNEERVISDIIGSYQIEKIDEMEKVIAQSKRAMKDQTRQRNSRCKNVLTRIRNLRAKVDPIFTFRTQDVGSSSGNMSTMVQLPLREELYGEIMSLINRYLYAIATVQYPSNNHQVHEFNDDLSKKICEFLDEIKLQIEENVPETNSDWYYRNKVAEARRLIAKCEPAFSLQSQDVGSSSINIPTVPLALLRLHEELRYEIRSLIRMKSADLKVALLLFSNDHYLKDEFKEELQKQKHEVNQFLTEVNLQLEEKIRDEKNSDWYRNKIAESRMLIAKSYPPFPFLTRDIGYIKEEYQIFLSFKGKDTRPGFTSRLYDALDKKEFNIFMDDRELPTWDPIAQGTMGAIENSKLSIIVFSENFADSPQCLDEVIKILECKEKNNQLVWSIFYKVEITDVRHQKNKYEEAMGNQETRFGKDSEKVNNWRLALKEICSLKVYAFTENRSTEDDFIQSILKEVNDVRGRL